MPRRSELTQYDLFLFIVFPLVPASSYDLSARSLAKTNLWHNELLTLAFGRNLPI